MFQKVIVILKNGSKKEVLKLAELNFAELEGSMFENKLRYITNLYNELDDTNEFINQLYTA